jgi:hypothetical protein
MGLIMKLSREVCANAADTTSQGAVWAAIGIGATVDAEESKVRVVLKDGRKFSVVRKGHDDYKIHGEIAPFSKKAVCELGKKFIQVVRKNGRMEKQLEKSEKKATEKAVKVAKEFAKDVKIPKKHH